MPNIHIISFFSIVVPYFYFATFHLSATHFFASYCVNNYEFSMKKIGNEKIIKDRKEFTARIMKRLFG